MADKNNLKLGKKPYRKDKRDLLWRDYVIKTTLPPLPNPPFGHCDLVKDWGILANDRLGDCVVAGQCHEIMLFNAEAGKNVTFTDQNAISVYSAACGYNPSDPNSDQGCMIRDVLKYCQQTGVADSQNINHKIDGYVGLDISTIQETYESIYLFSSAKLGIQVPQSAIDQFNSGQPWTVVPDSPILGGHDVEAVGVMANGSIQVVTWGAIQEMTIPFFLKYVDECWSPLSKEMLTAKGVSLEGFDWDQLEADLASISQSPAPTPTPPTPPTPTKIPTHLAADPVSGYRKSTVKLTAELIDTKDNKMIANEKINFAVGNGHSLISAGSATTDSKGLAKLEYKIDQNRGIYPISVQFSGNGTYEPSVGKNILSVIKNIK